MVSRALGFVVLVVGLMSACGSPDTKLKITGLEPEKGDAEGGTYVRIKGNRFMADGPRNAKVYFGKGNNMRQGSVVRFASDSELIVEAPGGTAGDKVDVLVIFEPGGQLKIPDAFMFVEKNDTGPSVEDLNINKDNKKK